MPVTDSRKTAHWVTGHGSGVKKGDLGRRQRFSNDQYGVDI